MTMMNMLKDLTVIDLSSLRDGSYSYYVNGPGGGMDEVCLHLTGSCAALRQASFDLRTSTCNRDIRADAMREFRREYKNGFRDLAAKYSWRRIHVPAGKSQLTFSIRKGEEGEWLHKAAQFLSSQDNLVERSPVARP
jgi:hypothetical protein